MKKKLRKWERELLKDIVKDLEELEVALLDDGEKTKKMANLKERQGLDLKISDKTIIDKDGELEELAKELI